MIGDAFSLPSFQQQYPYGMSMSGPSGFAGDMPPLNGGMFGNQQKKQSGLNPLMFLSPMLGMMMSHGGLGNAAMFGLSPALGIAHMMGAFK